MLASQADSVAIAEKGGAGGEVDLADYNMEIYHLSHDCDTPNNP